MRGSEIIVSHSPEIVTRKTGNEYILVPVTGNVADMNSVYTLNETGAFLWEQIDGKKNIAELTDALTLEYEISRDEAEKDVQDFLDNLKEYLIIRESV